MRFSNQENLLLYIEDQKNCKQNILIDEIQNLDDEKKEFVLLNLRKIAGVDSVEYYLKFKSDLFSDFKSEVDDLLKQDLVCIVDNSSVNSPSFRASSNSKSLKLTKKGLDFANIVWEKFI